MSMIRSLILADHMQDCLWKRTLEQEFEKLYFTNLQRKLQNAYDQGKVIYPTRDLIFNAMICTPLEKVKVVIIGQDPYHGYGQATGLAFSVQIGIPVPCSLKNMYKMLYNASDIPEFDISDGHLVNYGDQGVLIPNHGCLMSWAQQGVLLLNSTLTVQAGKPNSHGSFGWQDFTDVIIRIVSDYHDHVVFILMGEFAQTKKDLIAMNKHIILETTHPASRASYQKTFQRSNCFSDCNTWLKIFGKIPVKWSLV